MPAVEAAGNFCRNLRILRKRHGLSLPQMSQLLGVSIRQLAAVEAGRLPPGLPCSVVLRACEHFHLSPLELFQA